MKEVKIETDKTTNHCESYEILLLAAILVVFGISFILLAMRSPKVDGPIIVYASSKDDISSSVVSSQTNSGMHLSSSELSYLLSSMQSDTQSTIETNGIINIDTATADQLQTLNGIGPVKAQAIIDYRNQTHFSSIEQLMEVKGIGQKTFDKIKDRITVG